MTLRAGPHWYRTAVFYEVLLRAFYDGDGDGTGDFPGLIAKLDYLEWLGVDCLWIPPFCQSPLRDGGYDVSDFRQILPAYGTLDDVIELLEQAHARGIRVIGDMVINHTSDAHPWFQEARRPGSAKRTWYVWSDTEDRYANARIIFTDTELSNWTWDPTVGAYYWHRFFSYQPDLNYGNPEVQEAMLDEIRFWFRLGFDGLRLDAAPYLYEREGTNCENLPETHAYLKRIRAVVDAEFEDRVLLAEANQRPADVVGYFGDGDECHLAYHFPLMPQLFIALRRQEAGPIVDLLAKTPDIPTGCQWGIFLRNHDELTLEMITDEERAYMNREYAPDRRTRLNLGIRRRLSPLLDGDRGAIELLHGLLFSLPGSPFMYYGDEIGMGDAYLLPDRDGLRTPMQWTNGVNAGFSTANPAGLYLPVVSNRQYSPEVINVEAQRRDPRSLLNWVRRLIHIRKQHPAFGLGTHAPVSSSSPAVLAFLREHDGETVLIAANLAQAGQRTELDLQGQGGWKPADLMDDGELETIGERPYPINLGGHEFRWLQLRPGRS